MNETLEEELKASLVNGKLPCAVAFKIARKLKVSPKTIGRWENGYTDSKGRCYKGWKAELEQMWAEDEKQLLEKGIMLKSRRLEVYDELAEMALQKLRQQFPLVTEAKTNADLKALMAEVRELTKQAAIEKGEYRTGDQTLVAVKADISLTELQERYMESHGYSEEDTD